MPKKINKKDASKSPQIEMVPIKDLKPSPYNPNKMEDVEFAKLKKSLSEFGFVDPAIINKGNEIIGGEHRIRGWGELRHKEAPCLRVDLSPIKERALNLALNKIHGQFDLKMLKDLLEEIDTGEIDTEITGFDEKEIEDLMTQFHQGEAIEDNFDAAAEAEKIKEPITKPGEIFALGGYVVCPKCGKEHKNNVLSL